METSRMSFNGPYWTGTKGPYLGKTAVVGSYKANGWGLNDMHGNVEEWCADWSGKKLMGGTDPLGPSNGYDRVIRGGSWSDRGSDCRSAYRFGTDQANRSNSRGFRVAVVPVGAR
jgi:sulfatase modifying factor 1